MIPFLGIFLSHWEWNVSRNGTIRCSVSPCDARLEFESNEIDFQINHITVEIASCAMETGVENTEAMHDAGWLESNKYWAISMSCKFVLHRYSRVNSSIQEKHERSNDNACHFQHLFYFLCQLSITSLKSTSMSHGWHLLHGAHFQLLLRTFCDTPSILPRKFTSCQKHEHLKNEIPVNYFWDKIIECKSIESCAKLINFKNWFTQPIKLNCTSIHMNE